MCWLRLSVTSCTPCNHALVTRPPHRRSGFRSTAVRATRAPAPLGLIDANARRPRGAGALFCAWSVFLSLSPRGVPRATGRADSCLSAASRPPAARARRRAAPARPRRVTGKCEVCTQNKPPAQPQPARALVARADRGERGAVEPAAGARGAEGHAGGVCDALRCAAPASAPHASLPRQSPGSALRTAERARARPAKAQRGGEGKWFKTPGGRLTSPHDPSESMNRGGGATQRPTSTQADTAATALCS